MYVITNLNPVVAEAAVDAINFIAKSPSSREVLKSANLLKGLNVNALIEGEGGTGKVTLARYILPEAKVIDNDHLSELEKLSTQESTIILKDFDKILDINAFRDAASSGIRFVATTKKKIRQEVVDEFFSVRLHLKPLKEREEDIKPLAKKFLEEARAILGGGEEVKNERLILDLKDNAHSLRRSIFFTHLIENMGENEIMIMMENFLINKIGGNNDYRDFLYLYEAPLIRSALKKFKSQLQVADRLGLNRNTLRKKINELSELL